MKRISTNFCLALFLCVTTAKAFPTEKPIQSLPEEKTSLSENVTPRDGFDTKESRRSNTSSISTTSSLLFKDKKPILTYLLGQPKKQGGVSSPAQLLSPDRYEFFTFDDDGQIVKKLMSVKEIQKIIANNEKGALGDQGSPIEYYQILTVTPDVESIPSVSRINPNEPLFSIHDVIASVQNVLKSEIKIKQSGEVNGTYVSSASNDHFEIVTEQPSASFPGEFQKVTLPSTAAPSPSTFTIEQEIITEDSKPTTDINYTFVHSSENTRLQNSQAIQTSLVSTETTQTSPPTPSTSAPSTTTTAKTTTETANFPIAQPLSLADAHPGLISNESFLDMKPIIVEQISRLEPMEILNTAPSTNPEGNYVKVETIVPVKATPSQSTTPKIEIPIRPDLAESVSSVLWQIASENSMMNRATESVSISPEPETTEAQSRSTEKLSENPIVALENILRPQNRPRPFQKIPLIEKETSDVVESRIEPFSPTTFNYDLAPSPSSTVVIINEPEVSTPETNITNEYSSSTTAAPQSFVVSVSPDAVVQSPEHLKPVTDKVLVANLNATSSTPQQNQTIEGVQVIQEASIGQIPRTTEFPGQAVKEVQRMETPITDFVVTEESLTDSASNAISTQLPYVAPEVTTVIKTTEIKTEIPEELPATTTLISEPDEAKTEYAKENSASDKVQITFVPMVIKTPSAFKEEVLLKTETQTETNFEEAIATTTDSATETEQSETTELEVVITTVEQEGLESKELPEAIQELKSNEPIQTTTEASSNKEPIFDETLQNSDFPVGSLKQNKPYLGKPQKPIYIKPVKAKPQDTKSKPSATVKPFIREPENKKPYENHLQSSPSVLELDAAPDENLGLEVTVANLDEDIKRFADLCNELAFSLWSSVTHNGLSFVRSIVISPFAVSSLLAMVFLGARGPTSGQMNDILKLDDMMTFNPHLVFRNVTESLVISRNPGVATTAFVRELYSDKAKGKLLDFYKERVQQFYDGHVEEVNFKTIGETLRRQTNHLVKRQTWGKITDFLRGSNLLPRPPLAAFSANIFQTDCTRASTKDRDGEMYFVILPASRLRRLVPIPAVVYRDSFLAGYEPTLDATAVSISPSDSAVSTIFVLPGQQGLIAPGDTLARLEHHLLGSSYNKGHWSRLMRSLLPRPGLELQIPRLSHKSVINVTSSLQRMGLKDLFSADKADLTGLNGLANDLHLSDMIQVNLFSTCGEEPIGNRHHSEIYPATPILRREKSSDNIFSDSVDNLFAVSDFEDPAISALPLELRPRQARIPLSSPNVRVPEPPRLRFDRPFLFFVRHNPTGLILHMGRFNPRLMP